MKFNACGAGFPLQLQNCAQVNEVKHRKRELHEVYPENSRKKITLDLVSFTSASWEEILIKKEQDKTSSTTPTINGQVLQSTFLTSHQALKLEKAALFAMEGFKILLPISPFVLAFSVATASDPSPLQDFFVALKDAQNGVFVNGNFCKDPKLVKAEDFFFSGLNIPGNTSNQLGSKVTPVNVEQIPGLSTLAISLAWIDFAHYGGLNPPHTDPRASEILVVLEVTLYNRLITKVLYPGDVFVFPVGKTNAVAFAGLSSQNPGVITIANAVLGSKSSINPDILSKAFQLDKNVVTYLQSHLKSCSSSLCQLMYDRFSLYIKTSSSWKCDEEILY
ncbi:Cupin 1 - like 10, partial [Theobroma cacao]